MISLQGIVPPLITPLEGPNRLDIQCLQKLIEHIVQGCVNAAFILGTTGEGPSLSQETRKLVLHHACRIIDRRIPLIVGISDTSFDNSLELAKSAANRGADAVVLCAPSFFPISQNDLLAYVKNLAKECPLPIFLYNMPSCTKTAFAIETLKTLAQTESIVGIKDSSGDLIYFKELVQLKQLRPDWSILMGPEQLISEAILCGGDGGVCGGANLFPELYVHLYNATISRNSALVEVLQQIVLEAADNIYRPDYLSGLKYAMSQKQICRNILAEPLHPAGHEQQVRIQNYLTKFDHSNAIAAALKINRNIIVDVARKKQYIIQSQKASS